MEDIKLLLDRLDQRYLKKIVVRITELRRLLLSLFEGKSTFEAFNKLQRISDIATKVLNMDDGDKAMPSSGDGQIDKPKTGWVTESNPAGNTSKPDAALQEMSLVKALKMEIGILEKLNAKRKSLSKKFERLEQMMKNQEDLENGELSKSRDFKSFNTEQLQKATEKLLSKQKKYKELLKNETETRFRIEEKLQLKGLRLTKHQISLLSFMIRLLLKLVQRLSSNGTRRLESEFEEDVDDTKEAHCKVAPYYPFAAADPFPLCKDYDIFLASMYRKDKDLPLPPTRQRDVYMTVVKPFTGRGPYELTLKLGQKVKQKIGINSEGMAYGWTRSHRWGAQRYGHYPADCLALEETKPRD